MLGVFQRRLHREGRPGGQPLLPGHRAGGLVQPLCPVGLEGAQGVEDPHGHPRVHAHPQDLVEVGHEAHTAAVLPQALGAEGLQLLSQHGLGSS